MKTFEQMQARLAEQQRATEDATDLLANQIYFQWVGLLEEGIDRAFESKDPRRHVESHSNQLAVASQARYENTYGDALERAADRVVEHFLEQKFECWKTLCTAVTSITVSWDPEPKQIQNDV